MSENKHANHRERMRNRFIEEKGFDNFSDHEVLEVLLYLCLPRCNTNEIAHDLLEEFGSFSSVLEKSPHELSKIKGLGETAAVYLSMITEFCKRYYNDKFDSNIILDTSDKMANFIIPKFIGCTEEQVYCICMNNVCRVLTCSLIARGDISSAGLSVRTVVEVAIRHNSTNVILAHNHPQGLALPSNDDIAMTKSIQKALDAIGINLIDHFIVAQNDAVSLKQSRYF